MENFTERVYNVVQKIPVGKVATYSQIAEILGSPKAARAVGNVLHKNKDPNVHCHRIVNRDGRLAKNYTFGGLEKQREKLASEGVKFKNNKVLV